MTEMIVGILFPVLNFIGFIVAIIVLIKQFKHGGALQGILGIITCTFWTFIWGWIKHKSLAMTKLMVAWTVVSVVPLLLIPVFGAAMFGEIYKMVGEMSGNPELVMKQGQANKAITKFKRNRAQKALAQRNANRDRSANNRDWDAAALALWQDGQYSDPNKAKTYWDRAIATNSKTAEAYNNRGLALYNLEQHQQAIVDFNQAIQINPKYAEAFNNRGNAYYALQQYQQAEAQYTESLRLKPKYAKAHLNRGLTYFQMQRIADCCKDFKRACDLGDCDGLQWSMQNGFCK
ncbi:MAG: tetratricopeptide repeat protein [Desulfobacterales bacterium]|jgi:Flp pilus assembly protein TadD